MSEHRATVEWQRSGEFRHATYSRNYKIFFDGTPVSGPRRREHPGDLGDRSGSTPSRRSSPRSPRATCCGSSPLPRRRWVVESYVDEALGILDKTWMSRGHVAPTVTF